MLQHLAQLASPYLLLRLFGPVLVWLKALPATDLDFALYRLLRRIEDALEATGFEVCLELAIHSPPFYLVWLYFTKY